MPLFMTQFSYTSETLAKIIEKPQDRAAAVESHLKQIGGKLVGFYYSFGDYDGLIIYEAPDAGAALGMISAALSLGFTKTSKTTQLFSEKEGENAFQQAHGIAIQRP